jgi:septal ring factor EnvC (AmiA/AmiB activator)
MLKFKIIFILIFLLISNFIFADVKSELDGRNKELNQIKQNINKKKNEKNKLLKTENQVKKDLKTISEAINKNQKELETLETKIKKTEEQLSVASCNYNAADNEKKSYFNKIEQESVSYNKHKIVEFYDSSFQSKIRQKSLKYNSLKYDNAKNSKDCAQEDINKYTEQKKELTDLQNKQKTLIDKNKKLQEEKNKLLKTTAGKRIQAEQELKELDNSSKALKELVNKLTKQYQRQQQQNKPATSLKSKSKERRNNLPWPVDGPIVLNYGKNKHPTLNTNVISNGIKIKAKNNATVRVVDDGTVIFTGKFRSYGKMVIVDHKGVYFSLYSQLNNITVKDNQQVTKQQRIATLGSGEDSVLYFEIRQFNVSEDPLLWLKKK